ncbi:MAG: radical SAM protein [Anaerolineae bacterium]|nr:radical SAM protein [Anaerolineae bacterium]
MSAFLDLDRLEFAVTYRCNSHCKHCQVGQALRRSRSTSLDAALAVQIVRQVASTYNVRSVMCWGGEPLFYPDVVCAIHRTAMENGIAHRSVITNAGVPGSEAASRQVAGRLAESGVNSVYISVDAFHQEHVPLETVERNARALVDAGIDEVAWNPCWVVSREHDNAWNQRTREILQALSHLPVREDEGNIVQPSGNALTWLAPYLPSKQPMPAGSCEDVPYGSRLDEMSCISIEPDGGISICYDWTIGNATQENVLEILERYDPYAISEAKALLTGGVAALVDLAQARGIDPDPRGYYSICDLCRSMRKQMAQ